MIRSYALVAMDKQDNIIDRMNLNLISNPSDNGFQLSLSTIGTDIEDVVTKVVQSKQRITMTVSQVNNAYDKANVLVDWIQKYSTADSNLFLEYNDTKITRYCGGKVTKLTKTEKNEFGELAQNLEFTMTTPYFQKKENNIIITMSESGKQYDYNYPYNYGTYTNENNLIENPYILEVPIIVTISGAITNPTIDLLDENGNRYNRVKFGNTDNPIIILENETLIINSAQKKIIKIDLLGNEIDFRPEADPVWDTFLLAKRGTTTLSINTGDSAEGFSLVGGWRQYGL